MDQTKKLALGGVIAVAVLVVIILVAWPKGQSCVPSKDVPDFKALQKKNVASSDATALASLIGYVELAGATYLPVDIDSVSVSKLDKPNKDDVYFATLSGKCVSFNVTYANQTTPTNPKSINYHLTKIEMFVKNDANEDKEFKKLGDFDPQLDGTVPSSNRYSCIKDLTHSVKSEDKKSVVASLRVAAFELELDADPAQAKEGKFSKTELQGSCDYWKTSGAVPN